MSCVKSDFSMNLTDDSEADCVTFKNNNYEIDIQTLAAEIQQQPSHSLGK
jgi:hypothetical protein